MNVLKKVGVVRIKSKKWGPEGEMKLGDLMMIMTGYEKKAESG
jgi:hypothetical protein